MLPKTSGASYGVPMYEIPYPQLLDCIQKRRSTRAFQKGKPLEAGLLKEIVATASRAPSWKNIQPYRLIAVRGAQKEALCQELVEAAKGGVEPAPEVPYDKDTPSHIRKRAFELGIALYNHLGIDRKDKEARDRHALRNLTGFDAPALIFFYIPAKLASWAILDLGVFLGHLTLVCEMYGLGSCLQASLASYPEIVRKYTNPADSEKLVLGMSLGYPERESPENTFISQRLPVEEILEILEIVE